MNTVNPFHRIRSQARFWIAALLLPLPAPLWAAELVMVESPGCHYCTSWKRDLGPIYPKTAAGQYAPLRMIDIDDPQPADIRFARKVVFTPTFVLLQDGRELGRIEGYPGEDFFWGLLEKLLREQTDYATPNGT